MTDDETGPLCVPLVAVPRCGARESPASPLDIPFELASPSPSADMLSVRLRLDARESVGVLDAGELVAPRARWLCSSSEPERCLRPSSCRALAAVVVEEALCAAGSALGVVKVGSSPSWSRSCRWEGTVGEVDDGTEKTVLGGS